MNNFLTPESRYFEKGPMLTGVPGDFFGLVNCLGFLTRLRHTLTKPPPIELIYIFFYFSKNENFRCKNLKKKEITSINANLVNNFIINISPLFDVIYEFF